MVSEPPRPSVVTSLVSWETPWKPATRTILPSERAVSTRPGVTLIMRAFPCLAVVITPACEPVIETASAPNDAIAIATRALEIRSPAVRSMSISRSGGIGLTDVARSTSSSVVSPIAEHTTTTSFPAFLVATIRSATRRIRSADSREEPPYFCTTSAMGKYLHVL